MMPQFDTFSFFSQLFWVLIAFSYLYLVLCFYILPAFAAILKIRAKKLGQLNTGLDSTSIVNAGAINSASLLFFDNLSTKFNNIFFARKNLTNDINSAYWSLLLKSEAVSQLNFLKIKQFKIVAFFA